MKCFHADHDIGNTNSVIAQCGDSIRQRDPAVGFIINQQHSSLSETVEIERVLEGMFIGTIALGAVFLYLELGQAIYSWVKYKRYRLSE